MEHSRDYPDASRATEASVRVELFDAGTTLQVIPWQDSPGMDDAYFRGLDMEYTFPGDLQGPINERLRTTPLRADLSPWPVPFPGRCWIDWTPRYEGADGGLQIDTARWGVLFEDYDLVPAPTAQIPGTADYEPNVYRDDERLEDTKTVEEIQADWPHPTEWLRRPLGNETGGSRGGYCDLEQAAVMVQNYHIGDEFRPVINYSPLFAPVDLRHPEWYNVVNVDGEQISESPERWMSMRPDGRHRLYLRPANWRWVATVWANYIYVSWFEMFPTRLVFTFAHFDRPPIYPTRHDLIHTSQYTQIEYLNTMWSYDIGIEDAYNLSRGAQFLRDQIIDSQWWTQSEAFIFTRNDPLTLAMWLWPPEPGDIVLGIGTVDQKTGEEQVAWIQQNRDLTDEYQRQVTGSYIDLAFTVAS